jgi:hypothetical protein
MSGNSTVRNPWRECPLVGKMAPQLVANGRHPRYRRSLRLPFSLVVMCAASKTCHVKQMPSRYRAPYLPGRSGAGEPSRQRLPLCPAMLWIGRRAIKIGGIGRRCAHGSSRAVGCFLKSFSTLVGHLRFLGTLSACSYYTVRPALSGSAHMGCGLRVSFIYWSYCWTPAILENGVHATPHRHGMRQRSRLSRL